MKKRLFAVCFAALFVLSLSLAAGAKTTVSGGVYYTDFESADDFKEWHQFKDDGKGNPTTGQDFEVKDGVLVPKRPGLIIGAAYPNETYTNVLIETKIDKMARLEFRCDNASPWSDKRFYIEIDFGGAIILRNQADEEISSTLVQGLVSREHSDVKVRVYGNTVEVYLNEQKVPSFVYTGEALTVREGYCAVMLVWQNPSFEYFKLTELDENGLYNGKHPITGKAASTSSKSTAASSSVKKDESSKASASVPVDLSSEASPESSAISSDVPGEASDVPSTADTSSAAAVPGSDDSGGSSVWIVIAVVIVVILVCGVVIAVLIIRKNAGKGA